MRIRFPFRRSAPLLFACVLCLTARAQPTGDAGALAKAPGPAPVLGELEIARFSVADGLPSPNVSAIAQDSSGFLWIGTWDGLARYDGAAFEVYRHDPADPSSLSSPGADVLYVDAGGTLWVGTSGGGPGPSRTTGTIRTTRPVSAATPSRRSSKTGRGGSGSAPTTGWTGSTARRAPPDQVWGRASPTTDTTRRTRRA